METEKVTKNLYNLPKIILKNRMNQIKKRKRQ